VKYCEKPLGRETGQELDAETKDNKLIIRRKSGRVGIVVTRILRSFENSLNRNTSDCKNAVKNRIQEQDKSDIPDSKVANIPGSYLVRLAP
jgi:hypothetical protein